MPSVYIKKGQTPEGKARRLRAFRHNSYLGFVAMNERHMIEIINSDTCTVEAKQTAEIILKHFRDLTTQLRTRVD